MVKTYIGKHQTHNLDDSYLGSGLMLLNLIDKHGREYFSKEILFIFDTEEERGRQRKSLKKTFQEPGYVHPNKDLKRPDAAILIKLLPRKRCEYCGIETNAGNYGRYHGNKCKVITKNQLGLY